MVRGRQLVKIVSRDFPRADDAGHRGVIEAVGVGASRRLLRCSRASRTPSAAITISIGDALSRLPARVVIPACRQLSYSPPREVPGLSAAADSILTGTPTGPLPPALQPDRLRPPV